MLSIWAYFICCAFLSICNSAYVDTMTKCSYKDDKCVARLIENTMKDISKAGIPELNIPPTDPLDLSNITVPISGLVNITVEEGQLKGIKDCIADNIHNDMEKGVSNMDIICDLTIKAKIKIGDISPMVQNVLGQDMIRANGNVKLKLDKLRIKFLFFYHLTKKEDGDIYVECHLDEFRYNYEIGDIKMFVNKIFFGNQDISEFIVGFFNQNGKFVLSTFGKDTFDAAVKIFDNILHRFFVAVPVKYYLTDDLTPFVKN